MRRAAELFIAFCLLAMAASAQIHITTTTLPDGYTNGIYYNQALAATITGPLADTQTVAWSLPPGAFMPPGLTLDSAGNITGFPTLAGSYNITFLVQINFSGYSDSRQITLNIDTPRITIVTQSPLPDSVLSQPYQVVLQASANPVLAVQWGITSGNLPSGMTISPTGVISGTPLTGGIYTFTVSAFLANTGVTASQQLTITVYTGKLLITSDQILPSAIISQNYSYTLQSQPGANVTWTLSGLLPYGLSLNPSTGVISGVPQVTGVSNFAVQATAPGFSPNTRQFTMYVISGPLSILDTSLPLATLGNPYTYQMSAQGGLAPYLWRVIAGTLQPGLTLDLNLGVISGRPSATGPASFTIEVTDSSGTKYARAFTLLVAGPLVILTQSLPTAYPGLPYTQVLSAGGGQAPYTWSILSGDIPPGVSFSSSGILTGTPARSGIFNFLVQVVDNTMRTTTASLSIVVGAIGITTTSLPDAGFGVSYSQLLTAAGGAPPYRWSVISGSLPPGIILDPGGNVQGTPTLIGTYVFTVQATDTAGSVGGKQFVMNVTLPLQLLTTALPSAGVGIPYSQMLQAQGGTPPYSWSIELGGLPSGFTLNSSTGLISGTTNATGPSTFGILLSDSGSEQIHKSFTIVAGTLISISNGNLQTPLGSPITQTLVATGGSAPYRWSVVLGSLPPGLGLDGTAGIISGTPTAPGAYTFTLSATDAKNLSGQTTITITVTGAPNPVFTIGAPAMANPAQQPVIGVSINGAYSTDITGTLTLTFQPASGSDDPTIRFSTGTRVLNVLIPAGSTQATFPDLPARAGQPTLLTGTVAGTITLTGQFFSGLTSITPTAPTQQTTIAAAAPAITSVAVQSAGGGVNVVVTGYSNTLDMVSGLFHFAQNDVTMQLGPAFAAWYASGASTATGGEFTLTVPFPNQVGPVTVSLTNSQGASAPVGSQ